MHQKDAIILSLNRFKTNNIRHCQCSLAAFYFQNMKTLKCLLFSFFVVSQLHAQTNVGSDTIAPARTTDTIAIASSIDTISFARTSAYQKDFEKADQLLTSYNANHLDFHALSLHALVLYWMKAFDRSIEVYEKAINSFPEPSSLHLDYARVAFNLNKLVKARKLLNTYRHFDSTNVEADIMTAYLDLWNGKIALARKRAGQLLEKYPTNAEAKDIMGKINYWTVPYFKIGTEILSDDQPLKGHGYYAEAGIYKSWLFAPTVQAAFRQYKAGDSSFHSFWVQLANSIQLGTKSRLKVKGGVFQQNGAGSEFTGSAELSHQIAHNFSLQAGMEKRPYQYTISSIKSAVMENVTAISLSYNRKDKWFGKAAYELLRYQDANKINLAYLWILAPVISRPHFSISGGYAFTYADALKSNYVSKKSIPEIVASWPAPVEGVYNPYFTPAGQMIHSAIASIKIIPSKKLQFTSRLSIGLFAKADNPYLYLDKNGGGELFINGGFAKVDYMPATWVNELSIAASSRFFINAVYTYDKLLYYKSNRGSIELKYLFLK